MKRRFVLSGIVNFSSAREVSTAAPASSSSRIVTRAALRSPFAAASTNWRAMRSAFIILMILPFLDVETTLRSCFATRVRKLTLPRCRPFGLPDWPG